MALFLPILGDLKGRVGDNVFSQNAAGTYVRRGTKPVNTQTAKRTQVKNAFGLSSGEWESAIDNGKLPSWEQYAQTTNKVNKWGVNAKRTGRDWFMAINTFLGNALLPVQEDAPQTPGGAKAFSFELGTVTAAGLTLDSMNGNPVAGDTFQIQISAPYGPSRLKYNGYAAETMYVDGAAVVGTVLIPPANVAAGQVYFVQIRRHDTKGRISLNKVQVRGQMA